MPSKLNTNINGHDYFRTSQIIDGKRKWFYGSSKADAERKRREYIKDLDTKKQEAVTILDTITFRERADQYVENALRVSQTYANGTKVRYESVYHSYIENSELAKMKLAEIKASDIQAFYNGLDVTMSTIKTINKFMSGFYKWACKNEYAQNALSAVEMPQKPDNKHTDGITIWEGDEIKKIINAMDGHRLSFFVYILLYTGARISEAIALKYSDIRDDTVTINKQYYDGELKAPKYNSVRKVPMNDELIEAFEKHKAFHTEEMRRNGYTTEYIFTTSSGKLYNPKNLRTALERVYKKHSIPCKKVHAYRATFCTALLRGGAPIEVVSNLMGHKDLRVTAKHYALIKDDSKRDAVSHITFD